MTDSELVAFREIDKLNTEIHSLNKKIANMQEDIDRLTKSIKDRDTRILKKSVRIKELENVSN